MALRFAGKHCAVVGATGIIGSHIAKAFAREGAVISLLGRSVLDARPRLERELTSYTPPIPDNISTTTTAGVATTVSRNQIPAAHQFIRLDVSDWASIKDVFTRRDLESVGRVLG